MIQKDTQIYWSAGLLGALALTGLNYLANTPLRYIASMIGLVSLLYATDRLTDRFDIDLLFIRDDGLNYWSGAFSGLLAGIMGFYGTMAYNSSSFMAVIVDLSLIFIYLLLLIVLFTGTILQDIEDGYIEA